MSLAELIIHSSLTGSIIHFECLNTLLLTELSQENKYLAVIEVATKKKEKKRKEICI